MPILIFSFAKMKMDGYILFICPALFIITAYFFFDLKEYLNGTSKKAVKVIGNLLLISIIVLPVRYCFESTSFGLKAPLHVEYMDKYRELNGNLSDNIIVLNVEHPVEFMFYNGGTAYQTNEINNQDTKSLVISGFRIFRYSKVENSIRLIAPYY
jgi:hypothetical protein